MTPGGLAAAAGLAGLQTLVLGAAQISAAGLEALAARRPAVLQSVDFDTPSIGDISAVLAALARLPALREVAALVDWNTAQQLDVIARRLSHVRLLNYFIGSDDERLAEHLVWDGEWLNAPAAAPTAASVAGMKRLKRLRVYKSSYGKRAPTIGNAVLLARLLAPVPGTRARRFRSCHRPAAGGYAAGAGIGSRRFRYHWRRCHHRDKARQPPAPRTVPVQAGHRLQRQRVTVDLLKSDLYLSRCVQVTDALLAVAGAGREPVLRHLSGSFRSDGVRENIMVCVLPPHGSAHHAFERLVKDEE